MKRQIGERLGAICGRDEENKTIQFFGYGVYMGESIPDDGVFSIVGPASELGLPSPRIHLDSGVSVWGCESWFSSEDMIREMLKQAQEDGYTIKEITPAEYRDECKRFHEEMMKDQVL